MLTEAAQEASHEQISERSLQLANGVALCRVKGDGKAPTSKMHAIVPRSSRASDLIYELIRARIPSLSLLASTIKNTSRYCCPSFDLPCFDQHHIWIADKPLTLHRSYGLQPIYLRATELFRSDNEEPRRKPGDH